MFTVPPIDGVARFVALRPLCIWIEDVTSPKPSQFDQYTQPFSISLIGIPLIIIATFLWVNPRTLTLASPAPPPLFVANTEGVLFQTSGISLEPRLNWICFLSMSVNATGVSLSLALSEITVT